MEKKENIVVNEEQIEVLSPEEMSLQLIVLRNEVAELRAKLGNQNPIENKPKEAQKKKKKKNQLGWDICFYLLITAIILAALMFRLSHTGGPFSIAGYSAFTVLTSSMEEVIPKGSLVITKSVDPNSLKIGDDITFMTGPTTTVTHRIIGIEENYANTKARAFETKGVMNKKPDKDLVPAVNVVGKVIYHNKVIGDAATYLKYNWPYVMFVLTVIIVLIYFLKKDDEEEPSTEKEKKKKVIKEKNNRSLKNKEKNKGEKQDGRQEKNVD